MLGRDITLMLAGAGSLLTVMGMGGIGEGAGQGAPAQAMAAVSGRQAPATGAATDAAAGRSAGQAIVARRAADGLFYVRGSTGGGTVRFLVDTGANVTVLRKEDAAALGMKPEMRAGDARLRGIGGTAGVRWAHIAALRINDRTVGRIDAAVVEQDMPASLLGQDMLARLGTLHIAGDRMIIG